MFLWYSIFIPNTENTKISKSPSPSISLIAGVTTELQGMFDTLGVPPGL